MKRQICWTEKNRDGDRVDIRVTLHASEVKWQFKARGHDEWDYDTPPSDDQWDELEKRIQNRYQRGHLSMTKDLETVRRARGI